METRDICPHGFDFTDGNAEVFCPDCCLRPGEFVYCESCAERDIHTDIPGTRNDPTYTFVCPVCGHVQTYTPQLSSLDAIHIERMRAENILKVYVVEREIHGRYEYQGKFETESDAKRSAARLRRMNIGRVRVVSLI